MDFWAFSPSSGIRCPDRSNPPFMACYMIFSCSFLGVFFVVDLATERLSGYRQPFIHNLFNLEEIAIAFFAIPC